MPILGAEVAVGAVVAWACGLEAAEDAADVVEATDLAGNGIRSCSSGSTSARLVLLQYYHCLVLLQRHHRRVLLQCLPSKVVSSSVTPIIRPWPASISRTSRVGDDGDTLEPAASGRAGRSMSRTRSWARSASSSAIVALSPQNSRAASSTPNTSVSIQ